MKNQFKTPEVDVISFSVEDVVTASAGLTGEAEGDGASGAVGDLFPDA